MEPTERQSEILKKIVEQYIDTAQPVSSHLLEKECSFNVCPATIRLEMQKLTDAGFISQPHTSAGRVPTDKGYRFMVDNLLKEEQDSFNSEIKDWLNEDFKDTITVLKSLTKKLANLSSSLALGYLADENIIWKEGWEKIILEPELKETNNVSGLVETIEKLESRINNLEIGPGINVYIGKENPFSRSKEFSTIITRCSFPDHDQGLLAIIGPKRMDYDKNINFLHSLARLLEDF